MSQNCPWMFLVESFGHQVTIACIQGCPWTVLGRPLWDPTDIKSHQLAGMSQDCPGTSLVGSSGHHVTSTCRDVSGLSQTVEDIQLCLNSPGTCLTLVGNTGHPSKNLDNELENYKMYKYWSCISKDFQQYTWQSRHWLLIMLILYHSSRRISRNVQVDICWNYVAPVISLPTDDNYFCWSGFWKLW